LDRVNRGELKPKTAARMAGIVKAPTPLDEVNRCFKSLTWISYKRAGGAKPTRRRQPPEKRPLLSLPKLSMPTTTPRLWKNGKGIPEPRG
jgi:hypothetical protein